MILDESILPDFTEMDQMAKVSSQARLECDLFEAQLKDLVADCVRKAFTDPKLWYNDKAPTATYIEKVVAIKGNNSEDSERIKEFKIKMAEAYRTYEESKNLLENMRSRIAVFQTLSSNKRASMMA